MTTFLVFVLVGMTIWTLWRLRKLEHVLLQYWEGVTAKLILISATRGDAHDQERLLTALSSRTHDVEEIVVTRVAPLVAGQRDMQREVARLVAGMGELKQHTIQRLDEWQGENQRLWAATQKHLAVAPTSPAPPKIKLTIPQGLVDAAARRGVSADELEEMALKAFSEMVRTG